MSNPLIYGYINRYINILTDIKLLSFLLCSVLQLNRSERKSGSRKIMFLSNCLKMKM